MVPEPSAAPLLSAIVIIPESFEGVRKLIQALRAQTVLAQIELVMLVQDPANARIDESALQGFHSTQQVTLPKLSHATAGAEGIRRAHAPIVAMTEDHAFPAPNWAERLIAAHQGDYAAVGPAMLSGNPDSYVSEVDFFLGYGPWAAPVDSGERKTLMGHNSSYKRDVLLKYGPLLDEMLLAEYIMHEDLVAQGKRLWLEGGTELKHYNYERVRGFSGSVFYQGRVFAALRSRAWSPWRRLIYGVLSPAIPLVRFVRVHRDVARVRGALANNPKFLAVLLYGLGVDGAGQFMGYLFGAGDTHQTSMRYEFHRDRHFKAAPESHRAA